MHQDWWFVLQHIPREFNDDAEFMVKPSMQQESAMALFELRDPA